MPNYRIIVQYDPSRSVFHARAPELSHIGGEGPTRGEALAQLEEEIAAQLANARESGGAVVPAVDDAPPDDDAFSGDITTKVSRNLHRELAFQARAEGVELTALLAELLSQALEIRRQLRRRPASPASASAPDESRSGPAPGNDRRPPYRGGGGANQGGRYHAIMEDRATFLEYVRGLESGNAPPRNRGDRRRGPAGGGGGGGRGRGGSDGTPGNEGGAG